MSDEFFYLILILISDFTIFVKYLNLLNIIQFIQK